MPDDACPGDFTGASASVASYDFVSNRLTASGSAPLQILDVIPPTLTATVTPATLWPPNHKFQNVTAAITVTDNCDHNSRVTLVSVVSNEPERRPDSWVMAIKDLTFKGQPSALMTVHLPYALNAALAAKNTGRVYTITYRATNASGNKTDKEVKVTVPTNGSGVP